MKNIIFFSILLSAILLNMSALYAQGCPSSVGTIIPSTICGSFSVTLDGADCNAYGGEGGYLLYYDFDVSTTPTQAEIYDDLLGIASLPDAAWLGESSFCDGLGFVGLEAIPTGCTVQDIAFYIIPVNLVQLSVDDITCPIEGPIVATVYPTFRVLGNFGACDVPAEAGLVAEDGTTCDIITGTAPVLPDCTPVFGDAVNEEILVATYTVAQQEAIAGGTPPAGCYAELTEFFAATCASFACSGSGCQITNLVVTGGSCNNNGTPTDDSDDFWEWDFEFNFVDGTTFSVTDDGGGAGLSGLAYTDPASQVQTITGYQVPANNQGPVIVTITDDSDPACSASFNITDLLTAGVLITCSNCAVTSGSTVTTPVCGGAIEGIFTVTINGCMETPGTNFDDFILVYDLDVTNTPPTDDDLYADIVGQIPMPDLVQFGEVATCADGFGFTNLEGFDNFECSNLEIDLYIMPLDLEAALITFSCPIEGPIRLTTLPSQPSLSATSCDGGNAEVLLGFDINEDGILSGVDDLICDSNTLPVDASGNVTYIAGDIETLFGNDGSCYTDLVVACPCAAQAPLVTITGATCADGSMGAPYVVGDDGTGVISPFEITEYVVTDDALGTATSVPNAIISIGSLADAQAAVDAAPIGSDICITAIVYNPEQLEQIFTELDGPCSNGFLSSILGITPPLQSLQQFHTALISNSVLSPNLTLTDVLVYLGGSGSGPSDGGLVDIGVLAGLPPGLIICDAPPFCYNFMSETCVTINDVCPVTCTISNLTVTPNACDDNGTPTDITDDTYTVDISFDYSGAGATYTINDSIPNSGNAYPVAGTGTVMITDYGSYPADGTTVIFIDITDDTDPTCTTGATFGPVAACSTIPNSMATISDPCNCTNGIDLDGDGINDLSSETITITAPSGSNQGWTLTANDGNLVDADGTTPSTAPIIDNGDGTYTLTAYVVADGATTYNVSFTATDGEVLTISGGPCNMCPPPPDEVPTVGEWGLIILALLMSITAVVGIRQRRREEVLI